MKPRRFHYHDAVEWDKAQGAKRLREQLVAFRRPLLWELDAQIDDYPERP
jgi:hypothetical protein